MVYSFEQTQQTFLFSTEYIPNAKQNQKRTPATPKKEPTTHAELFTAVCRVTLHRAQ